MSESVEGGFDLKTMIKEAVQEALAERDVKQEVVINVSKTKPERPSRTKKPELAENPQLG